MRTTNPALTASAFTAESALAGASAMTMRGAVQKTTLLLGVCALSACFTWKSALTGSGMGLTVIGALVGFVVGLVLSFKRPWAPVLAPVYAVAEGLFLGGISAVANAGSRGIVVQAVALTFGTLFALLAAYQMRLIRASENFKLGIFAATGGIAIFYLIAMVLGFFGIHLAFLHEGGVFGILFSLFVVTIAALNLVLDFDFIENGEKAGAPKYMEWYAAFGLLVTLVWLYLEVLRLLQKLQRR